MNGSMQKFCTGEDEVAVFKKGVAASSVRGSTGRQCLNKFINFKGARFTQGGGANSSHPP